ncbi:MAG: hypothetical protein PGN13_07355 [Patulibacter minatonensis]
MSINGIPNASLSMAQSQAQWDAIAAIKENSPFAGGSTSSSSSNTAAAALDAMLPGYGTMSSLGAGGANESSLAQVTASVRAAQQSTIDLFA